MTSVKKLFKRLIALIAGVIIIGYIGACFYSIIQSSQEAETYTPIVMLFIICLLMSVAVVFIVPESFKNTILFAKTREDAIIPTRDKGNAGFDIYGLIPITELHKGKKCILINPHETKLIPTGIRTVIPYGYYIQIEERGSTGSKGIKYSAGVIDSSYRGEWFLATTNTNDKPVIFYDDSVLDNKDIFNRYSDCILYPLSKAIFQGVVHSTHNEIESKTVSNSVIDSYVTDRGEGKLGSSGK